MKVFRTVTLRSGQRLAFGMPTTNGEFLAMFTLRYQVYVTEKHYIPAEIYGDRKLDIDIHDERNECAYFVAMLGDVVVATARVIQANPLPIFQDYFSFPEPHQLARIPRNQIIEIGRIISRPPTSDIPPSLPMIGLFAMIGEHGEKAGLVAGYGAIKERALRRFEKIAVPIHRIAGYRQIYVPEKSSDPLKNFFDESDPPVPVYYLRDEVSRYCDVVLEELGVRELAHGRPADEKPIEASGVPSVCSAPHGRRMGGQTT